MIDGKLVHETISPTAASAGNRLYGPSGAMNYRVQIQTAIGAVASVDVEADSGDGAAEAALREYPGSKVMHVGPAPARPKAKVA